MEPTGSFRPGFIWEKYMDFIEQWFGISPDGGSGATEMIFVIVAALILAMIVWWWIVPYARRASSRRDT